MVQYKLANRLHDVYVAGVPLYFKFQFLTVAPLEQYNQYSVYFDGFEGRSE